MTEAHAGSDPKKYSIGTLTYSPSGLVILFSWLLWGDFTFQLMEAVLPSLLPILLKSHGASNKMIAIISTTILAVANSILNPIISYKSDRYRSKWGRRRPFILWTTPGVVLFLALVPFAPEISNWFCKISFIAHFFKLFPVAPMFLFFGAIVGLYQIFHMFVASVYYYLIPDTVPDAFLGRFFGMFRLFGIFAGLLFNYFIFGRADQYMKEIYVGISILYGIAITTMCLGVKEGEYPEPAPEKKGSFVAAIQNYARQCFGHKYYWWVTAVYAIGTFAGVANTFAIFFFRDEVGLSLSEYGKLMSYCGLASAVCAYPAGIILDKWNTHKAYMVGIALIVICNLLGFFFIHDKFTSYMRILFVLPNALLGLASNKWFVESVPTERYGQFGSSTAMISSIGLMVIAPFCGWLFDLIKIYRYFWLWIAGMYFLTLCCQFVVYSYWKKPGFKPPML